ncbi:hypothetical protein AB0P19_02585 [Microbacterium oleivorans]|uniref:hypothetical protein n=1 Tax=Microbacterium oleivorans TaxID=273677 RepID=UPI00341082B5
MTDPFEDETRLAPRTRRELRAERDDDTRLVARRAETGPVAAPEDADETLLAERRTDEGTRATARRVAPATTAGTSIAHGRADTPRTASAPGTLVSQPVYAPRRGEPAARVVRTPVAPPVSPAPAPARRSRTGLLLLVGLVGTAVVAGAVWSIVVLVQGGM